MNMNTTLTIKLPKKLRDDSKSVAGSLGVPLTIVVNALLRQFVRDRMLVIEEECPFPSHTPNAETRKALREILDYKKRHNYHVFAEPKKEFKKRTSK